MKAKGKREVLLTSMESMAAILGDRFKSQGLPCQSGLANTGNTAYCHIDSLSEDVIYCYVLF